MPLPNWNPREKGPRSSRHDRRLRSDGPEREGDRGTLEGHVAKDEAIQRDAEGPHVDGASGVGLARH